MGGPAFGEVGQGLSNVSAPFDPKYFKVEQGFMPGAGALEPNHPGVDYAVPQGSPIRAIADGCVKLNPNWTIPGHPVGYAITLNLTNGWSALYGHISQFMVKDGQCVHGGDIIGYSGGAPGTPGAGFSTGAHLHFELHRPGGAVVDPSNFLGQLYSNIGATLKDSQGDLHPIAWPGLTGTAQQQLENAPGANLPDVPGAAGWLAGIAGGWLGGVLLPVGIILLALLLIGFALYVLFRGGGSGGKSSTSTLAKVAAA